MFIAYLIIHDDNYSRVRPSYPSCFKLFYTKEEADMYVLKCIINLIEERIADFDITIDDEFKKYFTTENEYLQISKEYYENGEIIEELRAEFIDSTLEYIDNLFDVCIKKIKEPTITNQSVNYPINNDTELELFLQSM